MCRKKFIISCCILLFNLFEIQNVVLAQNNDTELQKQLEMGFLRELLDYYTLQSDAIVSEQCKIDCALYKQAYLNRELWALKMFDSSSKMQSGFLSGNLADFGDFLQCINLQVELGNVTIRGKHILTTITGYVYLTPYPFQTQKGFPQYQLPYLSLLNHTLDQIRVYRPEEKFNRMPRRPLPSHKWSICVPDSCAVEEVVHHLSRYIDQAGVTRVELERTLEQTLDSQWTLRPADWIVIGFFIFIAVLMLAQTAYDVYLHYSKNKTKHWTLISFSMLSNGRRLVTVSNRPELLPCLNGIRVICMAWIMLGHEMESHMYSFNYNTLDSFLVVTKFYYQFIFANQVHVDQFFMLGGLLIMYNFLRSREREPFFNIIKYYVRRYLRLTPSLVAAILVHLSILRLIGNGPIFQKSMEHFELVCKNNWWHSLLYISNYVDPYSVCVPQSWYLCVDTQLYWLSPLLLLPVVWFKKCAYYLFGIILAIGTGVVWYIVYDNKLIANGEPSDYLSLYHTATHCRISPWIIGHALGYFIYHNRNKKIHLPMWFAAFAWILAIAICGYAMVGIYPITQPDYVYDRTYNSWYVAFSSVLWCLGTAWVIFACIFGYGGIVNWFLSLSLWQPISKLTYSMFIIHYALQYAVHASLKTPTWFSMVNLFYGFSGLMGGTILLSFLWTFAFEMPFLVIDANLFRRPNKNQMTVTIPKDETGNHTNGNGA